MSDAVLPSLAELPTEQARRVERLCSRFETAWRDGPRPRLHDYLGDVDGPARAVLLCELLGVDLAYRRRAGETPTLDDYRPLLAEHEALLRGVFHRAGLPAGGGPLTTRVDETGPPETPAPTGPPATPFDEVVSLCEGFTGAFAPEGVSLIEAYLARVAPEARPTLLRNLLAIEVERRRAAGERPHVEEYLARFPEHASLVRHVLLEESSVSSAPLAAAAPPRTPPAAPPASRLGEYRLLRELGRGGMGVVYEAMHARRGECVALKTLPASDGAALHRFKREFRALADVNHPNLIGLHTLESDGCHWFFTMDLVDGVNFLAYVRPGPAVDEGRLRAALTQLVTGVLALHSRHIIHRDLKPSNVLVTPEGRVVVLDFGLVLEAEGSWSASQIAGTPRYMAPEQASGQALTSACDWYAVGVMLYEALAGRAPFTGGLLQVLQVKQTHDPPAIPAGPGIPADLAALAVRLLARDPDERPGPVEIVKAVAAAAAAPTVRPTAGARLVGREPQLAALQDAYRALRQQRQPLTVFVHGRSGEGKTTLAEHFLEPLRQRRPEVTVMAGRCYDRESVPFKALDSLIDTLASYLRALPETDAALLLPDDIGMLVQLFPVLQRVSVVEKAPRARTAGLDEPQVRQRAFAALRTLLWRIADRVPIVWCVDDLQWGDADSAEALFGVLRPPEAPAVLFLGTYRSDEAASSPFLRKWEELARQHDVRLDRRDVAVGPLSVEQCTELVVHLLGQDGDAIRRRAAEFAAEARGNPFLLIELVGCFDPHTDSFHALPIHEVIRNKLARLPADAAPLLEAVAVSGQALPVQEAAQAAGQSTAALATLTHMRNERLIRLIGTEERPLVDTYHDRIRETVLARLEPGHRQALHRRLAEIIEAEVGGLSAERMAAVEKGEPRGAAGEQAIPRVYDVAYHFDAAGEKRKAWMYALLAAEQARRQFALEVAVEQYAIAWRNAGAIANAARFRLAEGHGEALMLLGRYEAANEQLHGAIDLVEDAERKARVEALQGEVAFKQAFIGQSAATYESGLRRLGVWVPRSWFGVLYGVAREVFIQGLHSLLPFRLHRKQPDSRHDLIVRLLTRVDLPYCFQNSFRMLWSHLAGMNHAERVPPSPALASTYALHACWAAMLGWNARGASYGDRAIALARDFNDVFGYGFSCNYQGIGCYAAARYEEGLAHLTEAANAFARAGDQWELHLARFHVSCCHFGLGNLGDAVAEARGVFASSARLGDTRTMCSSWLWARAMRGNIPFDELKGCCPNRPDDIMSTVHGVLAEGYWHSFHGRTAEALAAFERAAAMVRTTMCVNSHTILTMPMLAMGLRRRADAVQATDAPQAAQLRKRARRVAKWATRLTWLFPAAYPVALRERALVLAACGKAKKALKFAEKSCVAAERQKARYEHAQSLLVCGQLARQLGRPEADEQIRTAEAAIDAIEKPVRGASTRGPITR